MKISVEYNLEDLTYAQLMSMLLFLRESNQIENIKAVNMQLKILDQRIGRTYRPYKFPEMWPKKTFWQRIFNK